MQNKIKLLILFVGITLGFLKAGMGQDSKEASVQKLMETKHFVFKAQSALPLRGGMRNLTSDYDIQVKGDSIISYLPYFGRAYVAPVDPTQGGLQFTSTDFSYSTKTKKGGWEITILPKDAKDITQLYLSVSPKGYARLQVLSNNRDAISFNGYVDKLK